MLAAMDQHRQLPGSPVAGVPAAQRADAEGVGYAPTGALLAASTTSLPETPQGERNWDYRYTWIRDSTFALWGLYTLGLDREADDFFSFIADVSGANTAERHDLQVMYGVGGERTLVEDELRHLSGYDNARPVRIGNGAYDQKQHDIWGSMLDSVYLHAKSREQVTETLVAGAQAPGRGGHRALARTRPRDLGGARRAAALHLEQDHVLGGAGPRGQAGRAARLDEARPAVARHRRGDQGRHPGQRRRLPRGADADATAATRWTPRCCWRC